MSTPGLAWQACLKKTEVKLQLIPDYDMFMIVEKGVRGGMCQQYIVMLKQAISI